MHYPDPYTVHDELTDAVLRYVDTAFALRNPEYVSERRSLLLGDQGALFSPLVLEPVLPYAGVETLASAAARHGDAVLQAGAALFGTGGDVRLRHHQKQSLDAYMGDDEARNVVITSGTGSGKTEAFLLPLLTRLVREASATPGIPAIDPWWESGAKPGWRPTRVSSARVPAMRAMVLYPTNALVEDQMSRLRMAVRRLRNASPGVDLWFGRYTGASPGSGDRPQGSQARTRVNAAAIALRSLCNDVDAISSAATSEELLAQFPDPRGGELIARWDMVATPPDILVTNYSMLNAILMRDIEENLLTQTRQWLAADPSSSFTLVVDELHLYRGTAGAEVAMVIRNLLHRLDLDPDSPKFRVIATSASLPPGESSLQFLEGFFGTSRSSFLVEPGQPLSVAPGPEIDPTSLQGLADADLARLAREQHWGRTVADSCRGEVGQIEATDAAAVALRVFPGQSHAQDSLRLILRGLSMLEPAEVPFRAHIMVRGLRGLWACCDPACTAIAPGGTPRSVGRLHSAPRAACVCGSRVLELLYCFECGDVSLGGYVAREVDSGVRMLATTPVEPGERRSAPVNRRTLKEYVWYWPLPADWDGSLEQWSRSTPTPDEQDTQARATKVTLAFAPASLDPRLGLLASSGRPTGLVLTAAGTPEDMSVRPCPSGARAVQ